MRAPCRALQQVSAVRAPSCCHSSLRAAVGQQLVLVNTNTSALTVRVDLFKPDGTALSAALNGKTASSFTNLNIPAGGVLILAPRDKDGDDDF